MPVPSRRLNISVLPEDPDLDLPTAALHDLLGRWVERGWLVGSRPGTERDAVVAGGFGRLWIDDPGRVVFYSSRQGGFRARCPDKGGILTEPFARAVQAWRAGGERSLSCPDCGQNHVLEAVTLEPPGHFARGGVVFSDVHAPQLEARPLAELGSVLGRQVVRLSRG